MIHLIATLQPWRIHPRPQAGASSALFRELATYGYSRDHRPDSKQVNLEVDVSHDGYVPVLYQVLPGGTGSVEWDNISG
jgi:hypothetical protein